MDGTIIAVISAILGGAGTKIIEKIFDSKHKNMQTVTLQAKQSLDEANRIRKELREEITFLKEDVASMKREIGEWRTKYYTLLDDYTELKAKYVSLQIEVEE